jgi:hypothetical protein
MRASARMTAPASLEPATQTRGYRHSLSDLTNAAAS